MGQYQLQSGVIPFRMRKGELSVLLITSRRRKRWIIPKGFIEIDMSAADSAEKEAFEEAGVLGTLHQKVIGKYRYRKWSLDFEVKVYPMKVSRLLSDYPEAEFRQRKWMSLEEACDIATPPPLKKILLALPKHLSRVDAKR